MEDFKGMRQFVLGTKCPHLEEPNISCDADLGRGVVKNMDCIPEERAA